MSNVVASCPARQMRPTSDANAVKEVWKHAR